MNKKGRVSAANKDFLRLLHMNARRLPAYFTGMLFMTLASALMGVLSADMSKNLVDAIESGSYQALQATTIRGIGGLFALACAFPLFMYMYNYQAKHIMADMRACLMQHHSRLPIEYSEKSHSGDMISRLFFDVGRASQIFGSVLRRFLAPIVTSCVYFASMLRMDWRISLILLAVNLLCMFVNTRFAKPFKTINKEISKSAAKVLERFMNLIAGAFPIRVFSAVRPMREDFLRENADYTGKSVAFSRLRALLGSVNFFFELITGLAFIVIAAAFVTKGWTSFGTLVGLVSLQRMFSSNLLQTGYYASELSGIMANVRRIFEFLDTPAEDEFFPEMKGSDGAYIEFRGVSFAYNEEKRILDSFSMRIERGEKVALVGPSGSGKSTVSKLLMGFYRPDCGDIEIDGETFATRSVHETRDMIAYVSQEPYLYNLSIKENIRYGMLSATDEEIIAAAKAANAHEFILEQPLGYDTIVGERGALLSGGQRQRIAIARAFVKNAPILILDEATSALDNESEQYIQEVIGRLLTNRTALIIAHRPATIAAADRVIHMRSDA